MSSKMKKSWNLQKIMSKMMKSTFYKVNPKQKKIKLLKILFN